MTMTTVRLRRLALVVGATTAFLGAGTTPQFLASADTGPDASVSGHVIGQVFAPGSGPVATCFGRPVTASVPPGGSAFYGSSDPAVVDVIQGSSGVDYVYAQSGNDFICGGGAYDHIEGGPGNDWIDGEQDGDSLYGGTGADVLYGGAGADLVLGEEGSDILFGQREDDNLACDLNPALTVGGTSDIADGGLGANDNLLSNDGCESVVNVEFP